MGPLLSLAVMLVTATPRTAEATTLAPVEVQGHRPRPVDPSRVRTTRLSRWSKTRVVCRWMQTPGIGTTRRYCASARDWELRQVEQRAFLQTWIKPMGGPG